MNKEEERRILEDVIRKLDRQENENLPQVQLGNTEVRETPRTCLVWEDENFSALSPLKETFFLWKEDLSYSLKFVYNYC